jgi:hypothetical protein
MKALLTILLLISFNSEIFSQSTIYHVRTDGDDSNNGLSWVEAFATIHRAYEAADSLDQVWVAAGTYHPTGDHGVGDGSDAFKHFRLKNGVSFYGGFPSSGNPTMADRDWQKYETILSGDLEAVGLGSERVLRVFYHPQGINLDNTALLDGFLITDGGGRFGWEIIVGGGMYNWESHPSIKNCVFRGHVNMEGIGAAMYNRNSNPIIENCVFRNNGINDGRGGAIYNSGSNPTIIGSVFFGNTGWSGGGAIKNLNSDPMIIDSYFINNTGFEFGGGGMKNINSNPYIVNCVFSGNRSGIYDEAGGGMLNMYSSPVIINSTFSDNIGNGVYNVGGSHPTVINSIIWGNIGDPSYGEYVGGEQIHNDNNSSITLYNSLYSNEEGDIVEGGGFTAHNSITEDPLFVGEAINPDHPFLIFGESPAVGAGDNTMIPEGIETDIRGMPRIVGGTVGIGAYEWQPGIDPISLSVFSQDDQPVKYSYNASPSGVTATNPIGNPYNKSGPYMKHGRLWQFFSYGNNYVVTSKQIKEGGDVSHPITIINNIPLGYNVSVTFDGEHFHFVWIRSGNIYWRHGTPNANGTLTMKPPREYEGIVYSHTNWDASTIFHSIVVGSDGKPVILARLESNGEYKVTAFKNDRTDIEWWGNATGFPFDLQSSSNLSQHARALNTFEISPGKILFTWEDQVNDRISARVYDGSWGDIEDTGLPRHGWTSNITVGTDGIALVNSQTSVARRNPDGSWTDVTPSSIEESNFNSLSSAHGIARFWYLKNNEIMYKSTADNGTTWSNERSTGWSDATLSMFVATTPVHSNSTDFGDREFHSVLWRQGEEGNYAVFAGIDEFEITTIASIAPVSNPPHAVGTPFWVEIEVGEPVEVTDLYGISFKLKSDHAECVYVDDSAEAGDFLGSSPLFFSERVDDQTVDIAVTRTSPPGVSGSGIAARAQFTTAPTLGDNIDVVFSLADISAIDSEGGTIPMNPSSLTITVTRGIAVWPGDTNNNGKVDASDLLPIGLYYGQTRPVENSPGIQWEAYLREPWTADGDNPRRVYADANGDGIINAQDVLAIGLNYGKTHAESALAKYIAGSSIQKSMDERSGTLEIEVMRDDFDNNEIEMVVHINSIQPVYGISFKLQIDDPARLGELYSIDVRESVLGEDILQFNRLVSEEGFIDVGLSLKEGEGITGEGELMKLIINHEFTKGSAVRISMEDLTVVDKMGRLLLFESGTMEYRIGEGYATLPTEYSLAQNYPNPFNPVTTIEYGLPYESQVVMVVYDMLGREVTRLVDKTQSAGMYRVDWGTERWFSSGMYIYRIVATANDGGKKFIESKRMILMK